MLQTIEGTLVYVVDLPENPYSLLPITGLTEAEVAYNNILQRIVGNLNGLLASLTNHYSNYARALDDAIRCGKITESGKYGIHVWHDRQHTLRYEIFTIYEPDILRKV